MVVTGRVDVRSLIEMYDAWPPLAEDLPLAEIRPPQPSTRQSNVPAPTESTHQPTAMAPETEVTKVTAVPFVLAVKTLQQPKDQAVTPTLKPVPTAIRIPTATRIVAATLQPTQASPIVARQHPTARPHGLKAATSRLFYYENDPKYLKRGRRRNCDELQQRLRAAHRRGGSKTLQEQYFATTPAVVSYFALYM